MELDHIFMFVAPNADEIEQLSHLGFAETYRREHPGQGTANVCYCFDNLYLELLWVHDRDAVRSASISRTKLFERSGWHDLQTCPFGIAWRGDAPSQISCWAYQPPYLAPGGSIPVAIDSDDPRQPMIFRSPGSRAPKDWPDERGGSLQRMAGLGFVSKIQLDIPKPVQPSTALSRLAEQTILSVGQSSGATYSMALTIDRVDGGAAVPRLPVMQLD